jgi:hypothetical protein
MKKMLIFSILSMIFGSNLSGQPVKLSPDAESYSFLSVYYTGIRIKLVQNEDEIVEKILARGTTHIIFLRKDHLGLPSVFFTNLNKEAPDKESEPTIGKSLVSEIRKLFREFLLSISLFNFLIEKQFITTNKQEINLSAINKNSNNELTHFVSVRR